MTPMLALYLLVAAAIVLVGMLVVTRLSRRLDRADATQVSGPLSRLLGGSGGRLHGKFAKVLSLAAGAASTDGKAIRAARQTKAVVSVFATIAVFAGVVSAVKGFNRQAVIPVQSELAAGELHGTMLSARNSDPVVLIVPGSGPTDRDGNSPAGLKSDAYRLLAEGLAGEGVASVRIDKFGMFGSAGAGDANTATPQSYASDYHAWIDAIKAERGSKCVWLLGHSEGALMVSLAAAGRKDVCGLILVSGMGRKMSDVIRQQLRDNPANAPVLDMALHAIDELEAGRHVDTTGMHPALLPLFAPQVQDYLIGIFDIDPVEAVRRAGKKTLIIQGTTDLQVTLADARLLNTAPKTRLALIDGMNHILKQAPADRAANLATYSDPSLPLAPKLVRKIEDFIKDND